MFRPPFRGLLAALLLALAPEAAAQSASLTLTVTEARTGTPLEGARASLLETRFRATTGADGVARLSGFPVAAHRVQVSHPGHVARVVAYHAAAGDGTLQVALEPVVYQLDSLEARGVPQPQPRSPQLQAFYGRVRDDRGGRFITRAEIEQANPTRFSDLFRSIPGAQIIPGARPGFYLIRFGRNLGTSHNARCLPRYFIDGMPFSTDAPDAEIQPDELEGVEVYSGSSAMPAQYGGRSSGCGVIVLWTREENR
jgi:hypothetical protein